MQISDYISGIALIISAVALYFCWVSSKQKQKLLSAQKRTELLQKMDIELFKIKSLEEALQDMLFMVNDDKEFCDFLIKGLDKNEVGGFNDINKRVEELRKKIKEYIKELTDDRESLAETDINMNPELFEKRLQHANRQLISIEYLISESEKIREKNQDAKDEYFKFKKTMLNKKK